MWGQFFGVRDLSKADWATLIQPKSGSSHDSSLTWLVPTFLSRSTAVFSDLRGPYSTFYLRLSSWTNRICTSVSKQKKRRNYHHNNDRVTAWGTARAKPALWFWRTFVPSHCQMGLEGSKRVEVKYYGRTMDRGCREENADWTSYHIRPTSRSLKFDNIWRSVKTSFRSNDLWIRGLRKT